MHLQTAVYPSPVTGENLLYLLGGGIMMALALGLILLLFFRKRKGRKEQED
jgi:LPXTG-motif cell wall-anchored protein